MYFSFMMVITENHSGGTKYTNTWRLQRICSVLHRSSLRCLLPSVYGLMGSSQRDRDLCLKHLEPGDSAVLRRLHPIKALAHRSTWTGAHDTPCIYFHRFSVKDLYECLNCWSHDEKLSRAKHDRDRRTRWRTELDSDKSQAWTRLVVVVSTQLIHNAFVF